MKNNESLSEGTVRRAGEGDILGGEIIKTWCQSHIGSHRGEGFVVGLSGGEL